VIVINLLGLVVISFAISQMSGASQMATAERNWLKDTAQIGAQAAGGVKWGKTEAIRSAYEIFQNDPKLALVGFTAFNQAGDQVDVWSRSETPDTGLAQVLNANPGEMKEATHRGGLLLGRGFRTVARGQGRRFAGADQDCLVDR
jgi:methyl-accepting chemotaxis protein